MTTPISIYLQKAWNENIDEATIGEVRTAIQELQNRPDQHDAFWVGIVYKEETVLEVSKDRSMVAVFNGDEMNALERGRESLRAVFGRRSGSGGGLAGKER
jgi:hypothetical protein